MKILIKDFILVYIQLTVNVTLYTNIHTNRKQ